MKNRVNFSESDYQKCKKRGSNRKSDQYNI